MPKVVIDGKEVIVGKTTSIFAAARKAGIEIPHFCHHFALKPVSRCRMCLVEIESYPKLMPSCSTIAADGMVIHTNSPRVKKARQAMLEFLLTTHPYECPICDQAGECDLQNYAYEYGFAHSRYIEGKEHHELKQLGPHVYHWQDRCILCTRCVRFANEISGTNELTVVNRGAACVIDTFSGKPLDNKLSGNVVDICPVGAMLSADSLYKSREWLLHRTESICPICSTGCNIYIDTWKDKIIRIKPRTNHSVNGFWICDLGRYHFSNLMSKSRLTKPQKKAGKAFFPLSWDEAGKLFKQEIKRIIGLYGNDSIAVLASPFSSNEDNFLLNQFADKCLKTYNKAILWHEPSENKEVFKSGFTIDADKSPNLAGAKEMLKIQGDCTKGLNQMIKQIALADIKALYIIGGNYNLHLSETEKQALTKLEFLAVNDMFHNEITELAHLVLPGASTAEKEGTFINSQGRIQLFNAAVKSPGEAKPDWEIIQLLSKHFLESFAYESAGAIFSKIASALPLFNGLSYDNIGTKGKLLAQSAEQKA
jgi:NADH-quinone oxidoreductase subunit G